MKQRVASLLLCILFCVVAIAQSSMIDVSRDVRLNRTAQLGGKAGVLFHSKSSDLVISTTVNSDPKVTMPKALGNNVYEYEMLLDINGATDRVFKISKKGSVISTKTGQVLLKANAYVGFNVDIVEKPIYMELSDEGGHYILHGNGWALIEINSEIKLTPNYNSKLNLIHRSSRSVAGVYVDSLIINVEQLQNISVRLDVAKAELSKLNAEYDDLLARNTSEGALNRLEKKIREVETTVSSLSKELDELSYISVKGEGTNERVIDAGEILALKSKEKRKYNVILQAKPQDGGAAARSAVTSQYVLFKVTPKNAMVELDGQMLEVVDGTTTKRMPFGTYSYSVQAPRHAVKKGTIVVNDPKNKHIVNITLEPQYVNAKFSVANNAEIWVDEQKRGTGSCTLELGYGAYLVECRLPGHKPSQQEVLIGKGSDSGVITLTPPTPVYGSVDINSTPADAEVWMDGKKLGTTPMFLTECMTGRHEVVLKKSGYKDRKLSFSVTEAQTATISETLEKGFSSDGRTFTVNGVSFQMVFVEGGTFRMGSDSGDSDENPVHDVTLSNYSIGKTEVTQALWRAVMGTNPSHFKGDNLPVENVSWNDCQTFIKKLNAITGANFRLPTEAEWEYAARGGKQSKNYTYSGSNDIGTVAWYYPLSSSQTHPVGQKQPNELGIYDMSGNVFEWCSDCYSSYSRYAQTNPSGATSGNRRVGRGGSWLNDARYGRSTYRGSLTPDLRCNILGFRLALPIEAQTATIAEPLEKGFSSDGRTFTVKGVSFEMVFVEGGTFRMGSDSGDSDEKPVHDVTLSNYSIGKTEVTQALWRAVMGTNPSYFKGKNLPVERVSWNDCQTFIKKLNAITGANFRLPTEAEWEYAARGGKQSRNYTYSGSNDIGAVAWYSSNSSTKTHPVGQKQPNELGIYDMSGNVWEWCSDWYSSYSIYAQTNPSGATSGNRRVRRGGGGNDYTGDCRSAYRDNSAPDGRFDCIGFRLALPGL